MNPGLTNIVDLKAYREKKAEEQTLARGRTPLYASHIRPSEISSDNPGDFAARIAGIRQSIVKINSLLANLKKLKDDGRKV